MSYGPAVDAREPPEDDFPPRRPFGVPTGPPPTEADEDNDLTPPHGAPGAGGPQSPPTPS